MGGFGKLLDRVFSAIGDFITRPESVEIFIVFVIAQIFSWLVTNWIKHALPAVPRLTKTSVSQGLAFCAASSVVATALYNMGYAWWLVLIAALFSGFFSPISFKAWKDFIWPKVRRLLGDSNEANS